VCFQLAQSPLTAETRRLVHTLIDGSSKVGLDEGVESPVVGKWERPGAAVEVG